jgi:hypothetical protein
MKKTVTSRMLKIGKIIVKSGCNEIKRVGNKFVK